MADIDPRDTLRHLNRPVLLTLAGMWAERLSRAFWPAWSLLIAAIAALAFGVQDSLGNTAWLAAQIVVAIAFVGALAFGGMRFRRPLRADALARLDATMPGRPIATLSDSLAIGQNDPSSKAVWQAHLRRMAERAARARATFPDLRLSSRDRFALRYAALTAFVVAILFGSVGRVASLSAIAPQKGGGAAGPAWEGWAQPPAYTGKPAIYLNEVEAGELDLPIGTMLNFRLYSEPGEITVSESVSTATTDPNAAWQSAVAFPLQTSGSVSINGESGRSWTFRAIPDAAPTIQASGEIGRDKDRRFKQEFSATDDFGVVAGQVTISLDLTAIDRRHGLAPDPEPLADVVLDLPMPLRGGRAEFTETLVDDLSEHLFANMPVKMVYSATDAAGNTGMAAPISVVLPAKRFFDPLAAALIEMRRDLLWTRENATRSVQILKAMLNRPEGFVRNADNLRRLRVLTRELDAVKASLTVEDRDRFASDMWDLALRIEEGDLANAFERLQRAQDRLNEAMKNGASPEEIDRLMQDMRQALNDYMQELSEEQQRNPDGQNSEQMQGMEFSGQQLQEMLDKLQQLMEEGKMAEAQELMQMLQQLMQNMQVTQGQGGQGQGQPGQKSMQDLGNTLRDQQGLSDDAFRDLQEGNSGEEPREGQQGSLSDRQRELRQRLDQMGKGQLPGDGTEKGEAGRQDMKRAEEAMRDAERSLEEGDLSGALDRQAEAMQALRDGIRNFGDALAEQQGESQAQQGERFAEVDPTNRRDPLGREPGDSARIGSDKNLLQGEDVYRRAQDLLDEIRKRSGELARPEAERDYLRRLLDLF